MLTVNVSKMLMLVTITIWIFMKNTYKCITLVKPYGPVSQTGLTIILLQYFHLENYFGPSSNQLSDGQTSSGTNEDESAFFFQMPLFISCSYFTF